jgi:superfamily I DNA/RNA helicase
MNAAIGKRVSYDQGCLKSVRKLPDYVSGKFLDLMSRYMDNPAGNGLNLESVEGSKDKSLKSLRLDQNYRAIAFETAKDIMFVHVNEHDKAYRWAEGRRVKLDTATNRIRIVEEIEQSQVEVDNQLEEIGLFSNFKDKKLLSLGVAEEAVAIARTIQSEQELDESEDRFDPLSFQVLYALAAGYSEEEVYSIVGGAPDDDPSTADDDKSFEDLIDTEESRQTIFTPQSIEELRRFFDGELEGWRVWLHPEQRKLAYKDYNGPAMVRGGAGTGKTVVAMHRAKCIADQLAADPRSKGQRVLITTFTTTLAKDIESNLKTLCPEHMTAPTPRIEVLNLDRWASQYLKKKQFERRVANTAQDEEQLNDLWTETFDAFVLPEGLTEAFVRAEWEQIIQAKGIDDLNGYLRASRAGRGTPLNRSKRKELWNLFATYRAKLIQSGLAERDDVYREAIPLLNAEPGKLGYATVIVDEAQDMGEQAFRLIRALIPESQNNDKNSIFIVGDAHQRIYGRRASMSSCGINIVGRSRKLKLNYRTTHEIRAWAVAVLKGLKVDDLNEGEDTLDGYVSVDHGMQPLLVGYGSESEELSALAQWVKELPSDSIRDSEIGILAFTNKQLATIQESLSAHSVETMLLSSDKADDRSEAGVRLCTMHRAKGLEFKAVAIPFMSASKFPPEWLLKKAVDEADREDIEAQLKSLLHVAATRAKGHLRVSWSGSPSPFIAETLGE